MCPSRVAAYSRPSGPLTTLVYIAVTAPDTAFSNAAGPLWLPVAPVVNTIEYVAYRRGHGEAVQRVRGQRRGRRQVDDVAAAAGDHVGGDRRPVRHLGQRDAGRGQGRGVHAAGGQPQVLHDAAGGADVDRQVGRRTGADRGDGGAAGHAG